MTLTHADGSEYVAIEETVDYDEVYVNGEDCDMDPCRVATLQVEP